jgi:hypothetical protein
MRYDEANPVQRVLRRVAGVRPMAWFFARVLHRIDGPVIRRTGGRWSFTSALTGLPVVELTTTGARTVTEGLRVYSAPRLRLTVPLGVMMLDTTVLS